MNPDLVVAAPGDALEDAGHESGRGERTIAVLIPEGGQIEATAWFQHRASSHQEMAHLTCISNCGLSCTQFCIQYWPAVKSGEPHPLNAPGRPAGCKPRQPSSETSIRTRSR